MRKFTRPRTEVQNLTWGGVFVRQFDRGEQAPLGRICRQPVCVAVVGNAGFLQPVEFGIDVALSAQAPAATPNVRQTAYHPHAGGGGSELGTCVDIKPP